mmetsp:Transcript_76915/g.135514  ORF Transcript_76915/g.135514 Transcript_76915/m.135514 type:complete len:335 (+) Transcript_76915:66-1070(+)
MYRRRVLAAQGEGAHRVELAGKGPAKGGFVGSGAQLIPTPMQRKIDAINLAPKAVQQTDASLGKAGFCAQLQKQPTATSLDTGFSAPVDDLKKPKIDFALDGKMTPKSSQESERKQQRRMLAQLHRCMARSGAAAFAISASALSRRMDSLSKMDEDSKFRARRGLPGPDSERSPSQPKTLRQKARQLMRKCVRTCLLRPAAILSNGINELTEAIGESPLRRTQQAAAEAGIGPEMMHESPLELFWAFNILLACVILSTAFVIFAFSAQVEEESEIVDQAVVATMDSTVADSQEVDFAKIPRLALRILVVACVSFTSGMGLRIIHPVQSALLCGL